MPRPRSPNRDKAFEIFKQHNGDIENRRIAEMLDEDEKVIAVWKSRDGWVKKKNVVQQTNDVQQSAKSCTTKPGRKKSTTNAREPKSKKSAKTSKSKSNLTPAKPGAPPGNKNAEGNRGGKGGPIRNKHAVRTHEYVTVFFKADIMDEEEQKLIDADYDKYVQQLIIIDTLRIREKRMLQDIQKLQDIPSGIIFESVTKNKGKTTTSYTNRNKDGDEWQGSTMEVEDDNSSHVARSVRREIADAEDRLLKVRRQLQKAIEAWSKMEMDDEMLALAKAKHTLQKQRVMGQYDLDAMVDADDLDLDDEL